MARMKAPNGADVEVTDDKAAELMRRGFVQTKPTASEPAKKAAPKKKSGK